MGKGDKKTKRGKIVIGSSGVRRARKKKIRKPGILIKAESKTKVPIEQNPVVVVPEITPVVEQVEEKAPKKTAVKKTAPKKPVEKVADGEPKPKPKATKSKKSAQPADDLATEKKEETE